MKFRSLLVLLDDAQDNSLVLQRVKRFAQQEKVAIEFLVVAWSGALEASYVFDATAFDNARSALLTRQRQWLEGISKPLVDAGLPVKCVVVWGKSWVEALCEQATLSSADLVIKSLGTHTRLQRALLSHGDWQLIRDLSVPLLFVKSRPWDAHLSLMAAVDPVGQDGEPQALDQRILQASLSLSESLPAELHVAHAYEPIPTGVVIEFDSLFGDYEAYREQVRRFHQNAFDKLMAELNVPSTFPHFKEGMPERVLPELAESEQMDVLVMGAVARTGLNRILIGTTAERVLDSVTCDLLLIR